ncbi:MAG: PAS domain-containing protein [Desulfovibrionaceae bacterium]
MPKPPPDATPDTPPSLCLGAPRDLLRTVIDSIPALLGYVDQKLRYQFVNNAFARMLHRSRADIEGRPVAEVLVGESLEKARPDMERALRGEAGTHENFLDDPDTGQRRVYEVHYTPGFGEDGCVQGYSVIGLDVTARKHSEEEVREQRALLQSIVDGMEAAIYFVDREQRRVMDVNGVGERLLGLSRDEIVGRDAVGLLCLREDNRPDTPCQLLEEKTLHKELLLTRRDGQMVPVVCSVLPVRMGGRDCLVKIFFDASRRKALERRLAYAQKLESVGQLAAGIAHEINTPIQYVGSNLKFFELAMRRGEELHTAHQALAGLVRALPQRSPELDAALARVDETVARTKPDMLFAESRDALRDSVEGVERVASIVLAMKKFSHPDVEEKKQVNINDAVQNTVTITRNEWKYVADLEMDLAPDLPIVRCVPGDLNQVLLNLIVNAAHAIGDMVSGTGAKGTITVRTRPGPGGVEIEVTDTGCGIPPENQSRIFDPFFTTKPVGKGTGQGLAITLAVIQKHGGSIDFQSEPGAGTRFVVRLPVGAPEAGAEDGRGRP